MSLGQGSMLHAWLFQVPCNDHLLSASAATLAAWAMALHDAVILKARVLIMSALGL